METMTINYDKTKVGTNQEPMSCEPNTIHVSRFSTEDLLLILHDDIVNTYDFEKQPKAIIFDNPAYGKRFSRVRLNDKTIWLHDDNTKHHQNPEKAKFTLTIKERGTNNSPFLDPEVINE